MLVFVVPCVAIVLGWLALRVKYTSIDVSHNLLFITAHPDDELMFFGPTLLVETRARAQMKTNQSKHSSKVHLLCLSNGDFYGDGKRRSQELTSACNCLVDYCVGSKRKPYKEVLFNLKIVNDDQLRDSPSSVWSSSLIQKYVNDYIIDNHISKVISFDQFGVSGHPNHKSIQNALKGSLNTSVQLWQLHTLPVWQKYLSWLECIFTFIRSTFDSNIHVNVISPLDYFYLVKAMCHHQSQMLWFRYLYLLSSSYMLVNILRKAH